MVHGFCCIVDFAVYGSGYGVCNDFFGNIFGGSPFVYLEQGDIKEIIKGTLIQTRALCVMDIEILTKEKESEWDSFVKKHEEGHFVHLTAYKHIIEDTYGYKGHYLYMREGAAIRAIFPFFEFQSFFGKTKFVSQPFSEYGGILLSEDLNQRKKTEMVRKFKAYVLETFDSIRGFNIEIHGQGNEDVAHKEFHVKNIGKIGVLKLGPFEDLYVRAFDRQVRKAIQKAEKEGVRIYEETTLSAVRNKFYPLYASYSKNRHGTPPHSVQYFLNCLKYAQNHTKVFFAEVDNQIAAALLGFFVPNRVHVSYNPSRQAYHPQRVNDLLHKEFIKWASQNNIRYFDFGPALYAGQVRYKEKWGVEFEDYNYYYIAGDSFVPKAARQGNRFIKLASVVWKYGVPGKVSNSVGPMVRKWMGT